MNTFQPGDLVVAKDPTRMRAVYKDWAQQYPDEASKYLLGLKFAAGEILEIIKIRPGGGYILGPIGSTCTDKSKTLWLRPGDLALSTDMQPVSDLL